MHQPMKMPIYMCGFYLMPTVKSVDNEQEKYDISSILRNALVLDCHKTRADHRLKFLQQLVTGGFLVKDVHVEPRTSL